MDAGPEMGIELAEEERCQIDECRDAHDVKDRQVSGIVPDVEEEVRSLNDIQSAEQEDDDCIENCRNHRKECNRKFQSLSRSQEDEISHDQQRNHDMCKEHGSGDEAEERSSVCDLVRCQDKEHDKEDDREERSSHELENLDEFRNDIVFLHEGDDAVDCTQPAGDERKKIRKLRIIREDLPSEHFEIAHHDPDFQCHDCDIHNYRQQ